MRYVRKDGTARQAQMKPVMDAQKVTPGVGHREGPWLEVTNFAIDCHFLQTAARAVSPEDLWRTQLQCGKAGGDGSDV